MNGYSAIECNCGYKFKPVMVIISENSRKYHKCYCRFCHKEVTADTRFELIKKWNDQNMKGR